MTLNLSVIGLCILILVVSSTIGHRIDEAIEESFNDLDQAIKKSFRLPRGLTRRPKLPGIDATEAANPEHERRNRRRR